MFVKMNIFSEPSLKILLFLGRRYDEGYYVREIARTLGVALGSASESLKTLEKMKLVKKEKKGRLSIYRANIEDPFYRELKILFTLLEIKELLDKLKPLSEQIILFGSCASGEDTYDSDVDLFIQAEDKKEIVKKISSHQSKVERKISPIIMSMKEFRGLEEKDTPLYDRIKSGKTLYRGWG